MKLAHIKLHNFRNYSSLELNFDNKLNILYGNNGSGKTNLVEAIYVLAVTKSFRNIQDKLLIKKNEKYATVEGKIISKNDNQYKIYLSDDGKRVKINNKNIFKISDYISNINIVVFSPDDLQIIKNSPSIRRKMINIEISQLNKEYLKLLSDYIKILKQRNSYLKQSFINGNSSQDYLNILTEKLVDLGYQIMHERDNYINNLNELICDYYSKITGENNLIIKYNSDFKNKTKEQILLEFKEKYKKELAFGKTIIGIHHDDIEFLLNKNNIKEYGSEGQQKNSIISLKLAQIELIKNIKKEEPILILDDLFSELDPTKINNIIKLLSDKIQTFITTTDLGNVNIDLLKKSKIFKVNNDKIEEEK